MSEMKSGTNAILGIPEVAGLDAKTSLVRIPPELDVPLTGRVRRMIDTPEFRRLADIEQLGFVSLIYPGARGSRFEHSLGVYRLALLVLKRLAHDARFADLVRPEDAELLIVSALLHDIGHYPYCHLIEDMKVPGVPPHEESARMFLLYGELARVLVQEWNIHPNDVLAILNHGELSRRGDESDEQYQRRSKVGRLWTSIISGPIDIDKMDYLFRDSHAAGVPYGRHFDQDRLIGSLCLNGAGDGLAITEKGKTAAELMVFARYVMFSEVYWHHAVRSATVMFQRLFDILAGNEEGAGLVQASFWRSTPGWQRYLFHRSLAGGNSLQARYYQERKGLRSGATSWSETLSVGPENDFDDAAKLARGLFGHRRHLYKRIREFSILEKPELYKAMAGRSPRALRQFADGLVQRVNALGLQDTTIHGKRKDSSGKSTLPASRAGDCPVPLRLRANDILIDAPPAEKEVEFQIDVYYPREHCYRSLSDVSPVVRSLAREQFDDYVKRVRVFARPDVIGPLKTIENLDELILDVVLAGETVR